MDIIVLVDQQWSLLTCPTMDIIDWGHKITCKKPKIKKYPKGHVRRAQMKKVHKTKLT
jgi:hypothetical protein